MTDLLIYLLLGAIPAAMIALVLRSISAWLLGKRAAAELTGVGRSVWDAERAARDALSEHERLLADEQRLILGARRREVENRESVLLVEHLRAVALREIREETTL